MFVLDTVYTLTARWFSCFIRHDGSPAHSHYRMKQHPLTPKNCYLFSWVCRHQATHESILVHFESQNDERYENCSKSSYKFDVYQNRDLYQDSASAQQRQLQDFLIDDVLKKNLWLIPQLHVTKYDEIIPCLCLFLPLLKKIIKTYCWTIRARWLDVPSHQRDVRSQNSGRGSRTQFSITYVANFLYHCRNDKLLPASINCAEILHTDVATAEANWVDNSFTDLRSFQWDDYRQQHNTSISTATAVHWTFRPTCRPQSRLLLCQHRVRQVIFVA